MGHHRRSPRRPRRRRRCGSRRHAGLFTPAASGPGVVATNPHRRVLAPTLVRRRSPHGRQVLPPHRTSLRLSRSRSPPRLAGRCRSSGPRPRRRWLPGELRRSEGGGAAACSGRAGRVARPVGPTASRWSADRRPVGHVQAPIHQATRPPGHASGAPHRHLERVQGGAGVQRVHLRRQPHRRRAAVARRRRHRHGRQRRAVLRGFRLGRRSSSRAARSTTTPGSLGCSSPSGSPGWRC